jgi:uncharacterized protein (TIGR02271 family)
VLNERELSAAVGSTAYDADGDKIGTVEHFFADDRTGDTTWVAVTTGLFGTRHSIAPAADATFADGALRLPVRKAAVRDAPQPDDASRLDPATEARLREHYGLTTATNTPVAAPPAAPPTRPVAAAPPPPAPSAESDEPAGRHAAPQDSGSGAWSATDTGVVPVGAVRGGEEPPGPVAVPESEVAAAHGTAPPAQGAMTRSEEQLRVGSERVVSGRVRLVKYVVTEEVQVTVPIRREEFRLEEIPAEGTEVPAGTGESLLPPGSEPTAAVPDEIVLHAERPVVGVEVVPVERVRLRTETVTGQEQVSERVQREQIVVDET